MKDFETFKKSRQKLDPKAAKMTDYQWEQAYTAYRNSRERVARTVKGESAGEGDSGAKRSSRQRGRETQGAPSAAGGSRKALIQNLRMNSAYHDLRLLVSTMAWIAIGLIVLATVIKLLYFTAASAVLLALLTAVLQVIGVFALKALAQVIIDSADLGLLRRMTETAEHESAAEKRSNQS